VSDADVKALRAKYVTACALEPWGEAAAVAVLLGYGPVASRREFSRHVTGGGVRWDEVLEEAAWSDGEHWLIAAAAGLWTGRSYGADVCRIPYLADEIYEVWLAMVAARVTGKVPGDG